MVETVTSLIPFKVLPLVLSKNKEFWEIYLKIDASSEAYRAIMKTLAALNLQLVHLDSNLSIENIVEVKGILDPSKGETSPQALEIELDKIPGVIKIRVVKLPFKGLGFYVNFYPPLMGDVPMVILTSEFFASIINEIKTRWGDAGAAIIYHIGELAGEKTYNSLSRLLGLKGFELAEVTFAMYRGYGLWRDYEMLDVDPLTKRAALKIYDSVECRYVHNDKPNGHFIRGVISGLFKGIMGRKLTTRETFCISKGDPYCEFQVEPG